MSSLEEFLGRSAEPQPASFPGVAPGAEGAAAKAEAVTSAGAAGVGTPGAASDREPVGAGSVEEPDTAMSGAEEREAPPLVFTSTTPSGIEIQYSPAPRRYYAVRKPWHEFGNGMVCGECGAVDSHKPTCPWGDGTYSNDWVEVPSVTTVLDVLNKPMAWWGQGVGVEAVLDLVSAGLLVWVDD